LVRVKTKMKKTILLVILLLGILFPFAAMTRFSDVYATGFNIVFKTQAAHIIMHSLLYAALSWLVMSLFPKHSGRKKILFCLGAVLLVAVFQESIQSLSVNYFGVRDSLFDIAVDLIAGSIPPVISIRITKSQLSQNSAAL
jgi:hypothetical protein